jgi:hypothetical protein
MNAYKVELLIINFDGLTAEEIKVEIENANYGNDCIAPDVKKMEVKDIGEWSDDHPLNHNHTAETEYKRLFP